MNSAPNPVYSIILVRTFQSSLAVLVLQRLFHWPLTGPHALGLFLTPLLCLYFIYVFVAPWSWGLPITTRLKTRERVVVLTFDDGPSPETTPEVLDILRRYGVQATFFVLGEEVERYPDLLRRIVHEGHRVGIHGFRHRALTLASASVLRREIAATEAVVRRACPEAGRLSLFRPPHGFKSLTMPWVARGLGCALVLWSLNPQDYGRKSSEVMARDFLACLHAGAITLLHDGPMSLTTVQALPVILDGLAERGYHCVSLGSGQGVE